MNLGRLILRELFYRKLNFLLGVLSVLLAVGCLVAQLFILEQYDRQTGIILAETRSKTEAQVADSRAKTEARVADARAKTEARLADARAKTEARLANLEEDFRRIGVKMGFNLLILPKDQNLADLYADDFAAKDMPEEYALRLASARPKILTINHVLPTLQQKIKWPERERTIILVGVRGQVLIQSPRQKPIMEAVPPGRMVVGHELHRSLNLKVGDDVSLLNQTFKVHQLMPEKGNKDDITVWINLAEAQKMLGKVGRINAILALECGCEAERLAAIRADVAKILPDTQVIEFATQAVARAEARNRARDEAEAALAQESSQAEAALAQEAAEAQAALDQEAAEAQAALAQVEDDRARHRGELEGFSAVVVPLVIAAAALWVGLLMFANVRERKAEIGILRAIGLGSRQILCLFLGKALVVGLLGALLGYAAGAAVAAFQSGSLQEIDPSLLITVLVAAPLVAGLASWVPALLAAQQDPALVLREG